MIVGGNEFACFARSVTPDLVELVAEAKVKASAEQGTQRQLELR